MSKNKNKIRKYIYNISQDHEIQFEVIIRYATK